MTNRLTHSNGKINDTPKQTLLNRPPAGPSREPSHGALLSAVRPSLFTHRLQTHRRYPLRAAKPIAPVSLSRANGTPVVNIVAPNAAGLSHNKFTDYNVGAAGLVLNNSRTAVQTQLGGVIAGNSQLGAKPAKVILNEVIGANPTMLNGTTEIAGKSAHLIVANPNGITVNGGGFINAPRTTLTTGKAMFDSLGNIANIDTTKGRIEIQGKGLDATRIDQLDLIARSIAVNAALHAEGAKVVGVGGVTRHNLASGTTQSAVEAGLKGEGSAPRTVAIDVSKLGSMYANSIRLVGSRDGVGVNGNNGAGTPVSARSMPEWGIDRGRINVDGLIQAGSGGASFSTGSLTVIGKTGTVSSARDLSVSGGTRNEGNILARTLSVENLDNSTGTLKTTGKMSVSGSTENTLGRIDVGSASFVGAVSNDRGVIHSAGKAERRRARQQYPRRNLRTVHRDRRQAVQRTRRPAPLRFDDQGQRLHIEQRRHDRIRQFRQIRKPGRRRRDKAQAGQRVDALIRQRCDSPSAWVGGEPNLAGPNVAFGPASVLSMAWKDKS